MAKRKVAESSEDEALIDDASDASESKPKPKRTKAKKTGNSSDEDADAPSTAKGKAKPRSKKAKKAEESSDEDEPIEAKSKEKKKAPNDSQSDAEVVVHKTSDGDKYIDLGKKKRATVRSFKGMPLLDIREFYGQEGDEKPGKKGISLSLEQWNTLKKGVDTIDRLFATVKK